MSRRDAQRCDWATSPAMAEYHDVEWGVPVHDDDELFEALVLEGAQAGLSWSTILNKREGYREAFHGFDVARVARFRAGKVETLVTNPAIVRHRGKIESTLSNAKAILAVQRDFGSFDEYVWSFVDGEARVNRFRSMSDLPAKTETSTRMSKALQKRGFRFVGPTTCYSFMQAVGMVNDHLVGCFRHQELEA